MLMLLIRVCECECAHTVVWMPEEKKRVSVCLCELRFGFVMKQGTDDAKQVWTGESKDNGFNKTH